ncbi:MAG: flagellar biosynthesis protein FlhF [Tepidisphaeraceae bacterium]|jgi:flagellar biosynthesis protein FlhF
MDLKTFQAPTMKEALAQVKASLGNSAVILHTRTYRRRQWLGLRGRDIVEVTAGRGLNIPDRTARRQPPPISRPTPQALSAPPGRKLLETPAGQGAAMLGLSQEMTGLKSMVKDLIENVRAQRCPQIPEEFSEYYHHLVTNQVCADLAADIVKQVGRAIRPDQANQRDFVLQRMADHIERLLPSGGPIVRSKEAGPHVVALIGPTGVGKTTTIAKLAANLRLREHRRVGLITIDTYRIAAIDQLRKYADIIGSPLNVTNSPEELRSAMKSMCDCEYILIDTAGRSPNDALKLSELKAFLAAGRPDEVHLVLSTTASQQCAELAVNRFSEVRADKIIFTKLDEAAHVGTVLNVVRKVNKSISYVTTGQDVPDDIEVGRGRKLAQLILGLERMVGQ